jgi:transcriptional regulator with XRE-family HTH domain
VLGQWIRKTRADQGLSQRALADRSGLSRSYVCDIERGRGAQPSVTTLDKLAAALGLSRADLLHASGLIDQVSTPRETEEERRILSVYRDLTDSGRASVLRFARFVHADEHHWVQPNLLDHDEGEGDADSEAARARMRSLTRPLFGSEG